jgi:hypothetical protein
MTDEDVHRHLESLLREFGEVSKLQVRHDERIREATEDREEMRRSMESLGVELRAAIGRSEQRTIDRINTVKDSCDKGWADMARWVKEYERDEREKRLRASDQAFMSKWQRRALAIGVVSAVLAALGVIVAIASQLVG